MQSLFESIFNFFKNNNFLFGKIGGSLITSRHVLTAAHCTKPPGLKFVRLGVHSRTTLSGEYYDDIPIKKIKIHERYNPAKRPNDICIILLSYDTEFSSKI